MDLRGLTEIEQEQLVARGCYAESWDGIAVSDDFKPSQLFAARFSGRVEIGSGVKIVNSYVANYSIGEGSVVEDVTRLECCGTTTFGNGVDVATINENGGRSVTLYSDITAQVAYMWALYRHRTKMVERFETMAKGYCKESTMGIVGRSCRIIASNIIRNVELRDEVVIEGAAKLESATLLDRAYIGVGVVAEGIIAAEDSIINGGASLKRAFVGERAIVASGFSCVDSLIFSSSHLENGEAASIFAGAHTVSHHKSSLLIAGLFSFFNAGSGSNQSNHLFKSGAVHQAIHSRGCKFASGAYVMAPAREGAFTMVKGSHSRHHDTRLLPYSYLIDDGGRSMLMPAANLISYGTERDVAKWEQRDRRRVRRDVVSYAKYNPYSAWLMVQGLNTLNSLSERSGEAEEYIYERVVIRSSQLRRGVNIYNKAIAASIGAMLSRGELREEYCSCGEWCDVGGAYIVCSEVERIIDMVERGEYSSFEQVDNHFKAFAKQYDDYAHSWAYALLEQLLGERASAERVQEMVDSAKQAEEYLLRQIESDRKRDFAESMAVGYGVDNEECKLEDFNKVRGI
ncbi:MAG: DUF4954 family protein [Rikenellaceae bacterium]